MTGTATGNEREFRRVFDLQVAPIPLARPSRRQLLPTRYFGSEEAKFDAIAADVIERHLRGQPVLIGSRTIRNSELIAERLERLEVPVNLLNGKQDLEEAEAIARAGEVGAVTVATNMAGRGTDIRLAPASEGLGGLHVAAVERHESRRIDRQLAGRCARQGDPGSCQFFVSADDDLLRNHAPKLAKRMRRGGHERELRRDYSAEIEQLQKRVEAQQYQQRLELIREDERLTELLAKATGLAPA